MKLTKDFTLEEFACADGTPVPKAYQGNVMVLATNLQALRDELGEPIYINSAYRTPSHNAKVGGVKDSQHVKGCAADITCKSKTPKQVTNFIEKLITLGKMKQGGIGTYKGFTHYDIRGIKARWNG